MKRAIGVVAVFAALLGACSNPLGPAMPECDRASGTMVLAVQAVPGSRYVSCIESLPVGWTYQDLTAQSGRSRYVLDSDRMGLGFLQVDNLLSCDVDGAEQGRSPRPDVELWKDVVARDAVDVVIVPEGPTEETTRRAQRVRLDLESTEIRGRSVVAPVSLSDNTTDDRVNAARADGAHVVVIGLRDVEEGTVRLWLRGTQTEETVDDVDELIERLEDTETAASYRGHWFQVFDGGCIRYTFDAEGPGADTLDTAVSGALGLYDAEELRQVARDLGYRVP
jgi:hypothetical protein